MNCEVCSAEFGKGQYVYTAKGRRIHVCPDCAKGYDWLPRNAAKYTKEQTICMRRKDV